MEFLACTDLFYGNWSYSKLQPQEPFELSLAFVQDQVGRGYSLLGRQLVLGTTGLNNTKSNIKTLFSKQSFQVYFAGDVHSAKESVVTLIRGLGFVPVDRGGLRSGKLAHSY